MGANKLVVDFIQDLEKLNSVEEVSRRFQGLIERFGFTYFCAGSLKADPNERGMIWATSLKNRWFKHWIDNRYIKEDPVIWHLKRQLHPVRWSDVRERAVAPRLDIFEEAAAFGMRDGWAVSFPFGRQDAPILAVTLGTDNCVARQDAQMGLHLAAVYCALKLARLEGQRPETIGTLSGRERECLTWVAAGKTDWEISEILGISQQTAHKHISNALGKLRARTRAQAVAIALSTKQIAL